MSKYQVSKATPEDFDDVVHCLDTNLSSEGFGFVNKMQINTELNRGTIWIVRILNKIVGVRVGKYTLWNIVVDRAYRGEGIGRLLMEVFMPDTIRVKNEPIGHLSKNQRDNFTDPTGFYEKMGYIFWGKDYGRNYWAGGTSDNKRIFVRKGKVPHISVFKRIKRLLFK